MKHTVLYGDCHHLECCDIESDYCLKRYFNFFDINKFEWVRYGFCNDHIRLELHRQREIKFKEYCRGTQHWFNFSYSSALEDYLFDFARKTFDIGTSKWSYINNGNHFNTDHRDIFVNFSICERPRLFASMTLNEATELIINLLNNKKSIDTASDFYHQYINTIEQELNKLLKYKKYKNQHDKCNQIIKRFNRNKGIQWWDGDTERMIELVIEFFKLNINKYESSKQ